MTKRFEDAVEVARHMAPAEQDALADVMMSTMRIGEEFAIPPEDLADVLEGLAQVERGEIASEAEVEAAFRRFRP